MTVGEVLRRTAGYLGERGSPSPRLDADLLVAHALGMDRMRLYLEHDRPLTTAELSDARALVARRGRREPVAYILGRRDFRALTITVTPDVLVPRPETETLVEWAVQAAPQGASVLDWGTGSGAVALALAHERPDLRVTAVDVSPQACAVAAGNALALGLPVRVVCSDGFAAVDERFGLIVANPPYLSDAELAGAPPELAFEPAAALAAGPVGDEALRRIAAEAPAHLEPGAHLLCEIGATQGAAVADAFRAAGLVDTEVRADLAGHDRVVGGRLPRA